MPFIIHGSVIEDNVPSSRVVRAYHAVTGEPVAEVVSSAMDGTYSLELPTQDLVYLAAFDETYGIRKSTIKGPILPEFVQGTGQGATAPVVFDDAYNPTKWTLDGTQLIATTTSSCINDRILVNNPVTNPSKFYAEFKTNVANNNTFVGVVNQNTTSKNFEIGGLGDSWGYNKDGRKYHAGSATSYSVSYTWNDIIMVALDMTFGGGSNKIWFGKNGVWAGDPVAGNGAAFSNLSSTLYLGSSGSGTAVFANENQVTVRPKAEDFLYTPPTGFEPYEA